VLILNNRWHGTTDSTYPVFALIEIDQALWIMNAKSDKQSEVEK